MSFFVLALMVGLIKHNIKTSYKSKIYINIHYHQFYYVDMDARKNEKNNVGQNKVNYVLILLPMCLLSILFTYLSKDIVKECIKKVCKKCSSGEA